MVTSARSQASTTDTNGVIISGCVPARGGPAGGTEAASSAKYLRTVRQSQPPLAANLDERGARLMQGAETTNVHPGLRIQDHERGTLRSVCLAVDSRRVTLTRAEEGSTRRDRPTHQVVRRTTYEVVRGHHGFLRRCRGPCHPTSTKRSCG